MSFPDNCLKGIPNQSFISQNAIGSHLFYFYEDRHRREDGWTEQSINWDDTQEARTILLEQTKEDGTIQFQEGLAVLDTGKLDNVREMPAVNGLLDYERSPIKSINPYHGNLLLKNSTPKKKMKQIAAAIALTVHDTVTC